MQEFELIDKYFTWQIADKNIIHGVGDDCAVINFNGKLITSTDTLIAGVHFFEDETPTNIAYKALAVNLSDIAAMGGVPLYFTLALTLPKIDENWLSEFSVGLKRLAIQYDTQLIGGDTTRGSLSITISIIGQCQQPILRCGAQVGDGIFVSNNLGGAKLALEQMKQNQTPNVNAMQKLTQPTPQIELGQRLVGVAHSCIDISDGLTQDLSHILQASNVGAEIESHKVPIFAGSSLDYALNGGDDYELCWTASHDFRQKNITQIGIITKQLGLRIDSKDVNVNAYNHF